MSHMRAAVFRGIKHFEPVNLAKPIPQEDEILVKVDYCGICGSDLHTYNKGLYIKPGQVMGHEFAGVVSQIGQKVTGLEEGQRVAIRPLFDCGSCKHCLAGRPHLCKNGFAEGLGYGRPGGFGEYVIIPKAQVGKNVFPLPEEISTKEGALIEPLAVAVHAVNLANIGLDDTVVIFGAGTIGLFVAQVVKTVGSNFVILVDLSDFRLEFAKKMGIDVVINARNENVMEKIVSITGKDNFNSGASADIVFECAGVPQTINQALRCVRFGGTVVSVALSEEKVTFDASIIVQKELAWKGSFGFTHEFPTAIHLMKSGKINAKDMITHTYPIERVNEAFEKQLDSSSSIKVCFEYN